jgi:hypothetical protein
MPEEVGLLLDHNGKLKSKEAYLKGPHWISNKDSILKFPAIAQSQNFSFDFLSKDDSLSSVSFEIEFKPQKDSVFYLFNRFGLDYPRYFAIPEAKFYTRRVLRQYDYQSLKTIPFVVIKDEIVKKIDSVYGEFYLDIIEFKSFRIELQD